MIMCHPKVYLNKVQRYIHIIKEERRCICVGGEKMEIGLELAL